jgi:phage terminase Nu1 subunit (DNA packaging protein)
MDKYTRKAVAAICGVTPPRIGQLVNAGVIDRNEDGSYSAAAITQYIQFIRKDSDQDSKFRELLDKERYREKKRENDVAETLVAPVETLVDAAERGVAAMLPVLDGLPSIVKRHWPGISRDQIKLVKRKVGECRTALAEVEIAFDE